MPATGARLRVVFLTHYFPPEIGAAPARLFELAKRIADGGDSVTVVTGFPNYPSGVIAPGYRGRRFMDEQMESVRVLRTWVFATPARGFLKRIVNQLSFAMSSLLAIRKVGTTEVIFVQSPPVPTGLGALFYARIKHAPFVLNISDLYPQSAIELGVLRNRVAIRLSEMFVRHLYRRASRIAVPTPGMLERLVASGVARDKVFLLTNGVDTLTFQPAAPDSALARSLGLDGHKIFIYAGVLGLAQGLDIILEAAKLTRDPDILYVIAGEGGDKEALVAKAVAQGISNVRFLPNQPKSSMPALLNLAYASIVPLKKLDLFKSALPSKMFESMAVGHPIVAAMWGEGANLVETARCGLVAEPDDPQSLSRAVATLAADPELARRLGAQGREYVVEHFDRKDIADRLAKLLREVARQGSA
jgi:glycosyltransferase involved in cell wall biosynthesis